MFCYKKSQTNLSPPCADRPVPRAQAVSSPHAAVPSSCAAAGDCSLEAPARQSNRAPTQDL